MAVVGHFVEAWRVRRSKVGNVGNTEGRVLKLIFLVGVACARRQLWEASAK